MVAVIDEFQEFALTTFAKVVTATRKYGLGLIVANQNLSRIRSVSPDVLATLLANAGTVVTFRTAPGDAETLAPLMAPFTADDLVNLAPYECYWRIPASHGPQVVSARTRPLPAPLCTDTEAAALARQLRITGRPIAQPTSQGAQGGLGPAQGGVVTGLQRLAKDVDPVGMVVSGGA